MKMIADVSQKEVPGADPDTVHYFKNVYLPSSVDIFEALGQTPDDIAKCTKKVTEAASPGFHNLTNPRYTPIMAMKFADETGDLSVHTFYHMRVTLNIIKCLTCGCLQRRTTISPH